MFALGAVVAGFVRGQFMRRQVDHAWSLVRLVRLVRLPGARRPAPGERLSGNIYESID